MIVVVVVDDISAMSSSIHKSYVVLIDRKKFNTITQTSTIDPDCTSRSWLCEQEEG